MVSSGLVQVPPDLREVCNALRARMMVVVVKDVREHCNELRQSLASCIACPWPPLALLWESKHLTVHSSPVMIVH